MTDIVVELPDKELLIHYPAFLMEKYLEGGSSRQMVVNALASVFDTAPADLVDIRHMARTLATEGKNPLPLHEEFLAHLITPKPVQISTIGDHENSELPLIA